jgi:erythromycin esterase-like protein
MTAAIKDAVHAVDAATVMEWLPARPQLLALGEPTHGEDVLLDVRNDLFRQLVEQEGYRSIAIESDCMMGLIVDDYVTSGTGTLDEAMAHGFSHEFGASAANRELVRWMREYNDGRPASEQLHFAGFDGPLETSHAASPRQALTALYAYLTDAGVDPDLLLPCTQDTLDQLLGADDQWANPATMMDPSKSVGQTPEAGRLRLLATDLAAMLDTHAPQLIAASSSSSRDDWDRARMYGRTAVGLLRYHYWMADTSPSRLTQLLGVRASMMAANLLAIADSAADAAGDADPATAPAAAKGPTLVHAHNGHLQRSKSSMRMAGREFEWWSTGAIVSARLGSRYAFLATALGTIRHRGVDAPEPDTIEGLLYALPEERHVIVDTRRLPDVLGGAAPAPRVSPWFGYAPLDPAQLTGPDAIVFVRDCPAN